MNELSRMRASRDRLDQQIREAETSAHDADFGVLLRLVAAEIDDQENSNCERYISDAAAAAFARQMSRLRTVQRKPRRQRAALRARRTAEPGAQGADDEAAAAGPGPAPREPGRPEDAVGFLAVGAAERVMALLRGETTHETIAGRQARHVSGAA